MELGAPFLETDLVEHIVRMAESSEVLTMRGTAFFVIGLISRSQHGLRALRAFGWDSAVDQHENSLGLCLPNDFNKLFKVRTYGVLWKAIATNSFSQVEFPTHSRDPEVKRLSQEKFKAITSDPDPVNQQILKHIVDMGNTVLSKRAAADLHRLVLLTKSITVTETKFYDPTA